MALELWLGIPGGAVAAFEVWRRGRRRYRRARRRVQVFFDRLGAAGDNARAIEGLAGSVTQLVVVILDRLDHLEVHDAELENRLDAFGEVLVDVQADVGRLKKRQP